MVYYSPCGSCNYQPKQRTRQSYWFVSLTITMAWTTHVFVTNLQKELLLKFEQNSKIKSQEFLVSCQQKALITNIFGQYDKARKTKIALETNYAADRQAGRRMKFLN